MMARYVRNSALKRFVHWTHTISTLVLFYTGLALYAPGMNFLAKAIGGFEVSRLLHRASAVAFILIPLVVIIFNFKGFTHFLAEIFSWGKNDTAWMLKFPVYLFKANTKMPDFKGKYKPGQKFAAWLILTFAILIALTGIVLWGHRDYAMFSTALWRWSLIIHDVSMIGLGIMLLGHIYLGLGIFQPYRGAWRFIFGDGTVSEEEAFYHWPQWAEEMKRQVRDYN